MVLKNVWDYSVLSFTSGGCGGARVLQTLNVYSPDYGMCLAQRFIEEKTNEIPPAQELLKLMDLKGTIV